MRALAVAIAIVIGLTTASCSSVSTVRVQRDSVHVAPNLRPIAIIHAQITSAYFLFIPIPGRVDLDRVVNQLLLPAAKALGADKVVDIKVDLTPDDGIWTVRKILGWRTAEATGIAVIEEPAPAGPPPASEPAKVDR